MSQIEYGEWEKHRLAETKGTTYSEYEENFTSGNLKNKDINKLLN